MTSPLSEPATKDHQVLRRGDFKISRSPSTTWTTRPAASSAEASSVTGPASGQRFQQPVGPGALGRLGRHETVPVPRARHRSFYGNFLDGVGHRHNRNRRAVRRVACDHTVHQSGGSHRPGGVMDQDMGRRPGGPQPVETDRPGWPRRDDGQHAVQLPISLPASDPISNRSSTTTTPSTAG